MKSNDTILLEQAYLKIHARSKSLTEDLGYGPDEDPMGFIPKDLEGTFMVKGAGGGFVRRTLNIFDAVIDRTLSVDEEDRIFYDKAGNRYKIITDKNGEADFVFALKHPSKHEEDRAGTEAQFKAHSALQNRVTPPSYSATGE